MGLLSAAQSKLNIRPYHSLVVRINQPSRASMRRGEDAADDIVSGLPYSHVYIN